MLENKITWSCKSNKRIREGLVLWINICYILRVPWGVLCYYKGSSQTHDSSVVHAPYSMYSLYNRIYFFSRYRDQWKAQTNHVSPSDYRETEKIKPQQGCSLKLCLLDSAFPFPETEVKIPREQSVIMVFTASLDIWWRIRNIEWGKSWMTLTGSASDITLQAAT